MLRQALERTADKRGISRVLTIYPEILTEIQKSDILRIFWKNIHANLNRGPLPTLFAAWQMVWDFLRHRAMSYRNEQNLLQGSVKLVESNKVICYNENK
ncbi:MAG: hypothetical protein LUD78_04240 [Clostridiales bacterium]|nr:hypothetical protein [Clostridiales bacterium]